MDKGKNPKNLELDLGVGWRSQSNVRVLESSREIASFAAERSQALFVVEKLRSGEAYEIAKG